MLLLWRRDFCQSQSADKFLLMAMLEVFLLLSLVWRTDSLCSPTTFFKNCWIRRFPGLTIDLEHSQRRGAHVLKLYTELTAQQCSRTCCLLKNVSCNLAVFYYETNHWNLNCLHVYCPALESCILKPKINVVLYNITAGVDPDVLVFQKLSFKDMNTRSSFNKGERHGSARFVDSEKCLNATTNSRYLPHEISSFTVMQQLATNSTKTNPADQSTQQTTSTTNSGPTTALLKGHFTDIISENNHSTAIFDNATFPTFLFTFVKRLSHIPSPAHMNNSKHLNETKGYSGRNNTSDDQGQTPAWKREERWSWLFPVGFCSSVTFICCCTIFLARGCQRKRKGCYRPRRRGVSASRQK
uniref:MANSC domain-containing protein 4 n=1 Tax=Pogona vitticeps TaxID=103695 RepID=A0A6J0T299_9SAUR